MTHHIHVIYDTDTLLIQSVFFSFDNAPLSLSFFLFVTSYSFCVTHYIPEKSVAVNRDKSTFVTKNNIIYMRMEEEERERG